MSKVVNLTVHKNTILKKRARNNASILKKIAKQEYTEGDISGFVVICWDNSKQQTTYIHSPTGSPVNLNEIPSFVLSCVSREISAIDHDNE